ncbi:uncharacterized protein LOC110178932 isoform X2 [Drosophila serrata]|uniref:uncharacterized protein LOC110178932 isoform X2 n=1 Tax=Drosophila serrata TaxID=7274 RepID=UPI000A1D1402|nr:uncharacterized protein LOC110178932 isoform X2 [Drosophila serrata]
MRSRSNGGLVSAPVSTRSGRSSANTAGTTRNLTRGSVGQIKTIAESRLSPQKRPLPPKSEYEKFYESVFLGNEEQEEEPEDQEVSTGTKRPLHALLNDEDSLAEMQRPSKIPAVRKTSEVVQNPKKQMIAAKDEVIRQINGPSSPVKQPAIASSAKSIHQKRHDRFDQLYNKTERHTWQDDAIQMLLQLWAQHIKGLRGTMRNTVIYKEMEKQMSQFGPSHFEIKTKMDNMSRKYRVEAEKYRESGVPSKWPYFHKIQSLLIGTKAVDVFEEMMFDTNTGASKFFDQDDSDDDELESLRGEYLAEDSTANDTQFEEDVENKHNLEYLSNEIRKDSLHSPSPVIPEADDYDDDEVEREVEEQLNYREDTPQAEYIVDNHTKRKNDTKRRTDRMLEIEEEKLVIEREKLKVMKEALQELSAFHKDLMKLIRTRK